MAATQKMLIVKELTFLLPKNFDGNLTDALQEYVSYKRSNCGNARVVDQENHYTTTDIVLSDGGDNRSCILYGIVEITEDGKYNIIESSSDNPFLKT